MELHRHGRWARRTAPLTWRSAGASHSFPPFQTTESESLVVLPDARMDLQLSLEPQQGSYFSSTEGWKPQNLLVGHATVVRQRSSEAENSTPN